MFAAGHEVEWATPVLYLRSPDGQVFTEGQISRAELEAREDAEPKTREAAERKAQHEAARKVGDYAEPTAGEDAERIASEEAERKAKQKAKREAKRKAEDKGAKAFNRGSSLQARGNVVGAKAAYQQAIDSGPTVGAALAAVRLGEL